MVGLCKWVEFGALAASNVCAICFEFGTIISIIIIISDGERGEKLWRQFFASGACIGYVWAAAVGLVPHKPMNSSLVSARVREQS